MSKSSHSILYFHLPCKQDNPQLGPPTVWGIRSLSDMMLNWNLRIQAVREGMVLRLQGHPLLCHKLQLVAAEDMVPRMEDKPLLEVAALSEEACLELPHMRSGSLKFQMDVVQGLIIKKMLRDT